MGATEEQVRRSARVLTGFMSQQEAEGFAESFTIDKSSFLAAWKANASLRTSLPPSSVKPRIEDLPPDAAAHMATLRAHPLFVPNYGVAAEIKMVELGRLIAMQHWVDTHVSGGVHGAKMVGQDIQQLLATCLSLSDLRPATDTRWTRVIVGPPGRPIVCVFTGLTLENSYGLKDLRQDFANNFIGLTFGSNANLILVREHGGRYVLAQGYHRSWLLRSKGIDMIPAVIVHVPNETDLTAPGFMQLSHIVSNRPPTIDDFFNDQASISVDVRAMMTSVKITIETSLVPRLL